jgi:hypothetical protein
MVTYRSGGHMSNKKKPANRPTKNTSRPLKQQQVKLPIISRRPIRQPGR